MDQAEEQTLARRLVNMDEAAWRAFCKEYSPALLRSIRLSFQCNAQKSEQIVQMAFVRCVRSIGTFDVQRGSLFSWLKAIAHNEARTLLGQEARAVSLCDDLVFEPLDQAPLASELLEREDVRSRIHSALALLNSRYRHALRRKYLEDCSVRQIAHELDVTEKAAESILTRARKAFEELLLQEEEFFEGRAVK